MRFGLASTVIVSCACWLVPACTPATPLAQEPVQALAGGSSTDTATAASGGSSGAGSAASAGANGGISDVSGVGNTHEQMCGGIAGLRCPDKQYCAYAPEAHCGAADMSGTCAPVPEVCMHLVDEVCGCDDKTYGNACLAARAGVSIIAKGACTAPAADTTPEGGLCGTRGASRDCAVGLYCAYKPDCGSTDAGGVCSKKPTICTMIYKPVCGCDGKTYGSACTAGAQGVSIVHDGPCKK
jgi:Kazal-type serine protease inhibitor domain